MQIELKNVKIHDRLSEETICFSATIYIDGKRVGEATNRGCGGSTDIHIQPFSLYQEFCEYCKSLPPVQSSFGPLAMDAELFIDDMVAKHEENQKLKRLCKKKTLFRVVDQAEGSWHVFNVPYTPSVVSEIKKHHKVIEFANERFS